MKNGPRTGLARGCWMKKSLFAAAGVAAALLASPASAATVTFASSVSFTESVGALSFTSSGLNDILTVGVDKYISNFMKITVSSGEWGPVTDAPITANFTFTIPTPSGALTDDGTIDGQQHNGNSGIGRVGTLSVDWPNQPVQFLFANGVKLDVSIDTFATTCTGNNCLAGSTYDVGAHFFVVDGPQEEAPPGTPLPAAVWLLGSVIAGGAGVSRWRKRKARAA